MPSMDSWIEIRVRRLEVARVSAGWDVAFGEELPVLGRVGQIVSCGADGNLPAAEEETIELFHGLRGQLRAVELYKGVVAWRVRRPSRKDDALTATGLDGRRLFQVE